MKYNYESIYQSLVKLNFSLNVICYVSLIAGIYYGSLVDYAYILLVYFFLGMTEQAFYHRLYSHKSWNCPDWLKCIGLHISTLTLMAPVIQWVAVHRKHHRLTDKPGDPHSPLYKSRFDIQFKSSFFEIDYSYASDLFKDRIAKFYTYMYFPVIFVTWGMLIYVMGLEKFCLIWLPGTSLVILMANGINAWHHGKQVWHGQYQLYTEGRSGTSKNDMILGYLHFDGWHNNHHYNGGKYYYGEKWWEIDITGIYIWILATTTGYRTELHK
jgi:stearoyl-CoA desaturase (delta-9 desaturase)